MSKAPRRPFPEAVTVDGEDYEVKLSLLHFRRLSERWGPYANVNGHATRWSVYDFSFLTDALALLVASKRGKVTGGDWVAEHLETPIQDAQRAVDRALCFILKIDEFAPEAPDAPSGDGPEDADRPEG